MLKSGCSISISKCCSKTSARRCRSNPSLAPPGHRTHEDKGRRRSTQATFLLYSLKTTTYKSTDFLPLARTGTAAVGRTGDLVYLIRHKYGEMHPGALFCCRLTPRALHYPVLDSGLHFRMLEPIFQMRHNDPYHHQQERPETAAAKPIL